jgi:GT2 family glycosyltransferase
MQLENRKESNELKPLVSIIILNFNGGNLIENCIESILNSDYENYEIILVDNTSKDQSHLKCKKKFPNIILIENKENLGYCEGNNVGIRKIKGEFLVILNPDTIVEKQWLENLLSAYKKFGMGLYQPKLLASTDKNRINTAGNMINIFGFGYSRGKGRQDNEEYNKFQEINFASGACLFTSKEVFDKVGFFDSFLFAYLDDLDFGWRAQQIGIKSYYVPTSIVYHAESFSFKWNKKKFFLLERNRWYCLLTHYSRKTLALLLPGLIIIELAMLFFYISKRMGIEKIRGYWDLIKHRKYIAKRNKELSLLRSVSDKELIKKFQIEIEVPEQVSGSSSSKFFNGILRCVGRVSLISINSGA